MKNKLLIFFLAFSACVHANSYDEVAAQSPIFFGALGAIIELEDGSIWSIEEADRHKTLKWLTTEKVTLTTNQDWFATSLFKMHNLHTNETVRCTLTLEPTYNGAHSHWIAGINFFTQEIYLEDGSIWQISGFDSSTLSKWQVNETILIGLNDGFFSDTKPHILINTNSISHVRAVKVSR